MNSNHARSPETAAFSTMMTEASDNSRLRLVLTSAGAKEAFPAQLTRFLSGLGWALESRAAYELIGMERADTTFTGRDVLLAYLGQGEADAFEMLKDIVAATHPLPVIAITERIPQRLGLHAMQMGAQDCIILHAKDEDELAALSWTVRCTAERTKHARTDTELTLAQESAEAMLILDRQGRVQFLNEEAASLLGRPVTSLLGHRFPFTLSSPPQTSEIQIDRPDGSRRDAEIRMVETEWGAKPARIVSLNDITLRRKLESALLRAEEARGQAHKRGQDLFARMGRELRTPLNDILGFAELIHTQALGPLDARYRDYGAAIRKSGKALITLIESLDGAQKR